ncbi:MULTISPECIES: hypothetical protein [unclassified Blastococcus]
MTWARAVPLDDDEESERMVWPVLVVVGFLALTGLVIRLGTWSTDRYEVEQRARAHAARRAAQPDDGPPTT